MKNLITSISLLLVLVCNAQNREKQIKFFNVVLEADKVLPTGKKWGPSLGPEDADFTAAISSPPQAKTLKEFIGGIYDKTRLDGTPRKFLNTEVDRYIEVLDEINIMWFEERGLSYVPKDTKGYQEAKKIIEDKAMSVSDKKAKLVEQYSDMLQALLSFRVLNNEPTKIAVMADVEKGFNAGLTVNVEAEINKVVTGSLSIAPSIKKLAMTTFTLSNGNYYEAQLDDDYIVAAKTVLCRKHTEYKAGKYKATTIFDDLVIKYFKETNWAVITKAAVIQATFSNLSKTDFEAGIKAILQANVKSIKLKVASIEDASAQIAAGVFKKMSKSEEASIENSYYYLRYVYNKNLEIGEGTVKDPCE